jgi:hypothetical protein
VLGARWWQPRYIVAEVGCNLLAGLLGIENIAVAGMEPSNTTAPIPAGSREYMLDKLQCNIMHINIPLFHRLRRKEQRVVNAWRHGVELTT